MHLSSSKSVVGPAPVPGGPDACQVVTRAQLGHEPPQRTVLGVLAENGQYGTCGQVMTGEYWAAAWGERRSCRGGPWVSLASPLSIPGLLGHYNGSDSFPCVIFQSTCHHLTYFLFWFVFPRCPLQPEYKFHKSSPF